MTSTHRIVVCARSLVAGTARVAALVAFIGAVYLPMPMLAQPVWTSCGTNAFCTSSKLVTGTTAYAGAQLDVEAGFLQVGDRGDTWGAQIRITEGAPDWYILLEKSSGKFRILQYLNAHNSAVAADRFVIDDNGNVGIGTVTPLYPLTVKGIIGAREVIVTSTMGADYVFKPEYHLRQLTEVSAYIQEHHHLPEVPSEAEVQANGIGVGEMQMKLLAKIEELTLHAIQADERNSRLERQNRELQDRMARLEAPVAKGGVKADHLGGEQEDR